MDRKLGDEWTDWDGGSDSGDIEVNERGATFHAQFAGNADLIVVEKVAFNDGFDRHGLETAIGRPSQIQFVFNFVKR